MNRTRILIAIAFGAFLGTQPVSAKQYVRNVQGRQVVVHSNPIPVVLHRMVPPQHGRHVTERELRSGKRPKSGRN